MNVSMEVWLTLGGVLAALLVLDFVTVSRKPHDVMFKEAAFWSIFYVAVAVAFGVWVWQTAGAEYGNEYFAAYLVEKSLSVDNLFVFVLILAQFAIPSQFHQRILLIGVILALVMRGVFIALGAAALHAFSFTFVIFGAILIITGIKLFQHWDEDAEPSENALVRTARRFFPITETLHDHKLFVRQDGRRVATPMFLVMIAVASTDLLFALDSIPATFGVTQEPFLVFSANAFALLGLRALYFLLKGLLDKLVYLSIGLAAILVFIGIKLVLVYLHEINETIPKISTNTSLIVIASVLVVASAASFIKVRKDPTAHAHSGKLSDSNDDHSEVL